MREHHVLLVFIILVGVGLKLTSFAAFNIEATSRAQSKMSVDIPQMHQKTKNIPMEKFHDMTFVFPVRAAGD